MNDYIQLWYDKYETEARTLMHDIWEHPEFAMEEYYTAGRLAGFMKEQGFETRTFNAKEPQSQSAPHNTVYAKWGSGKPVIGILGELDSLKGLGQEKCALLQSCSRLWTRMRTQSHCGLQGSRRFIP